MKMCWPRSFSNPGFDRALAWKYIDKSDTNNQNKRLCGWIDNRYLIAGRRDEARQRPHCRVECANSYHQKHKEETSDPTTPKDSSCNFMRCRVLYSVLARSRGKHPDRGHRPDERSDGSGRRQRDA